MLPRPENNPASADEAAISITVAVPVCVDLVSPPLVIGYGLSAVLRTTMPETAVDIDSDTGIDEHEVGPTVEPW
jgi:hypothetical protein